MSDFPATHTDPEIHVALVRAYLNGGRSEDELMTALAGRYHDVRRAIAAERADRAQTARDYLRSRRGLVGKAA